MLVFSVFFGRLAGMPSDGAPYPVFAFCALLPWQLFAHALTESSASLVTNQNLITKVYFPRLIIPLAPVLASLLDFLIAFGLLLGMLAYYRITPTLWVWTLPLFLLLAIALAIGVGLWLAALNARYRDVRSEEHTSELQSQSNLVCRLLLEKKKQCVRQQNRHLKHSSDGQGWHGVTELHESHQTGHQ